MLILDSLSLVQEIKEMGINAESDATGKVDFCLIQGKHEVVRPGGPVRARPRPARPAHPAREDGHRPPV